MRLRYRALSFLQQSEHERLHHRPRARKAKGMRRRAARRYPDEPLSPGIPALYTQVQRRIFRDSSKTGPIDAASSGEDRMKKILEMAAAGCLATAFSVTALYAQGADPQPTCTMCPGTYIPVDELQAYTKKAIAEKRIDQQVRDVDIGKSHVAIGMVYRGKLDAPGKESVAEHDLVSEVYHIIDGSGTLVLGPDLVNKKRRPADAETVRLFNGPGNNAEAIRNGVTYNLKPGDVVIIPAGTGHQFTKIDDHLTYLMVRIDPDKATPVMDEAASKKWLETKR
jgi:mannose-6-phosphate isomerase-like protein (cupin superfamily)